MRWCKNTLNTTITRVLLSNIHFCLISFLNDFFSRCFFWISVFITILAIRLFNLCCCYVLMITLYLRFIRFSCLHNLMNLISASFFIDFVFKFSNNLTWDKISCPCFFLIPLSILLRAYNLITKSNKRSLNFFSETKNDDKLWVKTYILTFLSKCHRLSKIFIQYSQVQKKKKKKEQQQQQQKIKKI